MFQFLGNLGQASLYDAQAYTARKQGEMQRSSAYVAASGLEEEARSDAYIAGKNMMQMRKQSTDAMSSLQAAQGASGFTGQGSAREVQISFADAFEQEVSNMALSHKISDFNKRDAATMARYQGDMSYFAADQQAQQYNAMADNSRMAGWMQLGSTALMGAFGGSFTDMKGVYDLTGQGLSLMPGTMASSQASAKNAGDYLSNLFASK